VSIQIIAYSRKDFEECLYTDDNVELYNTDYFICINATGWKHAIPFFKQKHPNVINLYFDDIFKTGLKAVQWFNNTHRIIYAQACTKDQAITIKNFIDNIPDSSTLHIYCAMGQSRSQSVAQFTREYRNLDFSKEKKQHKSNVYSLLCSISKLKN
jgi:hypothetical protein